MFLKNTNAFCFVGANVLVTCRFRPYKVLGVSPLCHPSSKKCRTNLPPNLLPKSVIPTSRGVTGPSNFTNLSPPKMSPPKPDPNRTCPSLYHINTLSRANDMTFVPQNTLTLNCVQFKQKRKTCKVTRPRHNQPKQWAESNTFNHFQFWRLDKKNWRFGHKGQVLRCHHSPCTMVGVAHSVGGVHFGPYLVDGQGVASVCVWGVKQRSHQAWTIWSSNTAKAPFSKAANLRAFDSDRMEKPKRLWLSSDYTSRARQCRKLPETSNDHNAWTCLKRPPLFLT